MSEPLRVPAGKTVYWQGLTYTEGMSMPADYPSPEHLQTAPAAEATAEPVRPSRAKER